MSVTVPVKLFARYPTPGRAQRRDQPRLGAAALHKSMTERALGEMRKSGLPCEIRATGAPAAAFRRWLGDVAVVPQGRGHLGLRMARAVPGILIGADVPGLMAAHLRAAAGGLASHEVVIGPAVDGGYWLIGARRPLPWLFAPMAWGTDVVFVETLRRCRARGLTPLLLETLADVDRPEDL
jgi:uncharacterized protein